MNQHELDNIANNNDRIDVSRLLYQRALVDRNSGRAAQAISAALGEGLHPLEIYDHVIIPAQIAIGELWHLGQIGMTEEHIATQISIEQINRLRGLLDPRPSLDRKVLVGALNGDLHWIGARVVADHFFADGWNVDFLGSSPPLNELLRYIKKTGPDLIALSVTISTDIESLIQFAKSLSRLKNAPALIVGGRIIENLDSEKLESHKAYVCSNPKEAIALARKLCGITGSEDELSQTLILIGQRIHSRRKALEKSQKEIADEAGLDRAYLSGIEGGKQNCTISVLFKLTATLGLSLEDLFKPGSRDEN